MIVPLDDAICEVSLKANALCVEFCDGRYLCAPLEWFPLLSIAKPEQRMEFTITDDGGHVLWPELGEKVSGEFLLSRRGSVARRQR